MDKRQPKKENILLLSEQEIDYESEKMIEESAIFLLKEFERKIEERIMIIERHIFSLRTQINNLSNKIRD